MKRSVLKRSLYGLVSRLLLVCWWLPIVSLAQPTITSFTPTGGAVGTIVTVTGSGFGTSISSADITVTVGNVSGNAIVLTNDGSTLTFMVSTRSSSGPITITRSGQSVSSSTFAFQSQTDLPDTTNIASPVLSPILAPAPAPNTLFGSSVDINANGSLFVVSNPSARSDAGEVHVYEVIDNCTQVLRATLFDPDITGLANQGRDVAISANGDVIAVGGPRVNGDQGRVWVYRRMPGTTQWVEEQEFEGPSTSALFGSSLDLSATGNTLVVGAPNASGGNGAAYVYSYSTALGTGQWSQINVLTLPETSTTLANYGTDVAVSSNGTTIAIGSPNFRASAASQPLGAVWVYNRSGSFTLQARLQPTGADVNPAFPNVAFGTAVSLSIRGNNLVVGAPGDNAGSGAVFVFVREDTSFPFVQQGGKLTPPTNILGRPAMGTSVDAIADGSAFITGGFITSQSGFAWLYERRDLTWNVRSTFTSPLGLGSSYGRDVSISTRGSLILVGAPTYNNGSGFAALYRPRLAITRITPLEAARNTTVTVSGSGFSQRIQSVRIGGFELPTSNYQVLSSNSLNITIPNVANPPSGTITIQTACAPFQQITSTEVFRSIPVPVVNTVSPVSAPVGATITITGRSFFPNSTTVLIGTSAATVQSVSSDSTTIIAIVGAANNGTIQVTTLGGPSERNVSFELIQRPTISGYSPSSAFNGQTVRIQGQNFKPTTTVSFGPSPTLDNARSVTLINNNTLDAVINNVPVTVDSVRIYVRDAGGTDSSSAWLRFQVPAPTFAATSAVLPLEAPAGAIVQISGFNLRYNPRVRFGSSGDAQITQIIPGVLQPDFTRTPDVLFVRVPTDATVGAITVFNKNSSSATFNGFRYIPPPSNVALSVSTAGEAATVVITGQNFESVTQVLFGSASVPITFRTSTEIRVRIGNLVPGATTVVPVGNVTLTWAGADPVQGPLFSFNGGPSSNVVPETLNIQPYQWVFINGENIGGTQQVLFEGVAASTTPQIISDTRIRIRAPLTTSSGTICLLDRASRSTCVSGFVFRNNDATTINLAPVPNRVSQGSSTILRGQNLAAIERIWFSTDEVASFELLSNDSIRATAGTGATGRIRFKRFNSAVVETTASIATINYGLAPTLTGFTASGQQLTSVTISGTNFFATTALGTPEVYFGTVKARSAVRNSASQITAIVDSGETGPVSVVLDNGSLISANNFTFSLRLPVITPNHVSSASIGQPIIIRGQFFNDLEGVFFDDIPATSWTFTGRDTLQVVVPNHQNKASAQIRIKNPEGFASSTRVFNWFFNPPTLSPSNPTIGVQGEVIQLSGTNFYSTSVTPVRVRFGTTTFATDVTVVGPELIEVRVPAGSGNFITVFAAGGNTSTTVGSFTYYPNPTITSITPSRASPGETVRINGANLQFSPQVFLGGVPLQNITISPTGNWVEGIVGFGRSGLVSVITLGGSATAAQGFEHFFRKPTITNVSPSVGKAGDVIMLTGSNFYGRDVNNDGLIASFGNVLANLVRLSSTQILATITNGATGKIKVTAVDSSSDENWDFTFYPPPVITRVTPDRAGPNTPIQITGTGLENIVSLSVFGEAIPEGFYSSLSGGNIVETSVGNLENPAQQQICIETLGGSTCFNEARFIPAPAILSIVPPAAQPGETITIHGQFLGTTQTILFQNIPYIIAPSDIPSENTVLFKIPERTSPGVTQINVVTLGGSADTTVRIIGEFVRPAATLAEVLSISPVPVLQAGKLKLSGTLVQRTASLTISIYDISGVLMTRRFIDLNETRFETGRIEEELDVSIFGSGIYFLQVVSGRESAAWRFIKSR